MYTDNRNSYRQVFFDVFAKHQQGLPLELIESQILDAILVHPEYHALLENPKTFLIQEFASEENPFIHLSLHIALHEQLRMNRPAGIKDIYLRLQTNHSAHEAEHKMITIIAQLLHQAEQSGEAPEETVYLAKLNELQ